MRNAGSLLRQTYAGFKEDGLSDWAAALTYYGLLSLFPAVIALVSILGLIGDPQTTTQKVTEVISEIGPESAAETFAGPSRATSARSESPSSSGWRSRSGPPRATSALSSAPPI